ncbi:MAG: hypothetical protein JW731_09650 [Bacteroidales bacterium]|nr:hypothetical protein [Bacteroidales bacterium]
MRSIFILLLGLFISFNITAQVVIDTTYSNEWNGKTQQWENFDRIITTYNNGLINSELVQVWHNNQWIDYNMKVVYYNNGLILEELEKYWIPAENIWEDNYRKLYSYNNNGQVSQITHQNIFNGKYINTSREIMKYSPEGLLIEKVVEKYEEAWSNFMRYQYYYNAHELLMEEELTYWDKEDWDRTKTIISNIYNSKGNLAEKKKARKTGSRTTNLLKEEYFYGINDRLEEHTISVWNGPKKLWTQTNRALFENNLNGYVISRLSQGKKKSFWENYLFTEYSGYKEFIPGKDYADDMTFAVYAANFGNEAIVEFTNPYNEIYHVSIINENGRVIDSATTDEEYVALNGSHLIKGTYFVELQGSNLYSGKFSIE